MTSKRAASTPNVITLSQVGDGAPWLTALRLTFTLFAFGLRLFFQDDWRGNGFTDPSLVMLLALIVFDTILLATSAHWTHRPWAAKLLAASGMIDLAAYTALAYWTGGPRSVFLSLFFPTMLAGSLFLSRPMAGLLAAWGTIGLSFLAGTYLWATQTAPPSALPGVAAEYLRFAGTDQTEQVFGLLLAAVFLFVLAFAAGWLGEQARSARRLADLILANTAEGAAYFENGRLLFANEPFRRFFAPLDDRARLTDLFSGTPEARRLLELAAWTRQAPRRLEWPAAEGRPALELRLSALARGDNLKKRPGLLILAIDLTPRREAERLSANFRAARELAAGLAHELRNPLASVRGAVQELGDAFPPESSQRRLAAILLRESDRLGRIITDFQKFAVERPPRVSSVRLAQVFDDLEALWRRHPDAGASVIELSVAPKELTLFADRDQLTEAIFNLGANALSMMKGQGRLSVQARIGPPPPIAPADGHAFAPPIPVTSSPDPADVGKETEDDVGLWIGIADTGPGIPTDIVERLFLPFVGKRPGGTGLGLAVTRRVIEAHGGWIRAANLPERGACFRLWLPFSGPPATPER